MQNKIVSLTVIFLWFFLVIVSLITKKGKVKRTGNVLYSQDVLPKFTQYLVIMLACYGVYLIGTGMQSYQNGLMSLDEAVERVVLPVTTIGVYLILAINLKKELCEGGIS